MNNSTYFYLGSNSYKGFSSLYNEFIGEPEAERLFIIKGGAGCGKSSFMRTVAASLSEAGAEVEYICCSGDPDSLDGILIPVLKTAYVDGTSPHVVEPLYPGARHSYLNLGKFYDTEALSKRIDDIKLYTEKYKYGYVQAYGALEALGAFKKSCCALYKGSADAEFAKRAEGIISRELKNRGERGSVKYRFLSSFSSRGFEVQYNTAYSLCRKLYAFDNDYGLAPKLMERFYGAAVKRGYDAVVCKNPFNPEEIEHVLIPSLSLGFISVYKDPTPPFRPYKHVRLNSFADRERNRSDRVKHRADMKTTALLYNKAVEGLKEAKHYHDLLEKVYNPHVDFEGVYGLADTHIEMLKAELR